MFLPDTNIFIRAIQKYDPEASFLKEIIVQNAFFISVIVIGEFFAKADERERDLFDKLLSQFEILPIDERVAKIAGDYRKLSLQLSRTNLLDCFLAAQAKVHKLTLVTNNKTDFPMKDIKIISP